MTVEHDAVLGVLRESMRELDSAIETMKKLKAGTLNGIAPLPQSDAASLTASLVILQYHKRRLDQEYADILEKKYGYRPQTNQPAIKNGIRVQINDANNPYFTHYGVIDDHSTKFLKSQGRYWITLDDGFGKHLFHRQEFIIIHNDIREESCK